MDAARTNATRQATFNAGTAAATQATPTEWIKFIGYLYINPSLGHTKGKDRLGRSFGRQSIHAACHWHRLSQPCQWSRARTHHLAVWQPATEALQPDGQEWFALQSSSD